MDGELDGAVGGARARVVVLAVVATIWLVKHLSSSGSGSDDRRILERRYASGDIDREEFLQRRDDLARRW